MRMSRSIEPVFFFLSPLTFFFIFCKCKILISQRYELHTISVPTKHHKQNAGCTQPDLHLISHNGNVITNFLCIDIYLSYINKIFIFSRIKLNLIFSGVLCRCIIFLIVLFYFKNMQV